MSSTGLVSGDACSETTSVGSAERAATTESVVRRGFEGLRKGEVFELPTREITFEHFRAFQELSGDDHPMHYDQAECRERGHDDLLAHGLQVTALGAAGAGLFPYIVEDVMLAFLEQSSRFLRPVLRGDVLRTRLVVEDLIRQRTTGVVVLRLEIFNQHEELAVAGEHRYLLRLVEGSQ